ncbi:MAG: imidazoleglycerol-phosphate dehydratase [Candidatus Hydrogenedentota bacterium]|nr:MAG: imidazoleglycerol-phosphate dehydratase [Candidatus Hydrogenedentota bacterium]
MRTVELSRKTNETDIQIAVNLDGTGIANIQTGIGFFDHMLVHLAKHGQFDITVKAQGDLEIDGHHTVEDVGILLGQAFLKAVGTPTGLTRFGHAVIPMDEALAEAAVDFSGRPFLVFDADLPKTRVGDFDSELTEEFFRAFAMNSRMTVHLILRYGTNVHHCIEVTFKAWARAMRQALTVDDTITSIPSTKGVIET